MTTMETDSATIIENKIQILLNKISGLSSSVLEKFGIKMLEIHIGLSSIKEREQRNLVKSRKAYREFDELNDKNKKIDLQKKKKMKMLDELNTEYKDLEKQITFFTKKLEEAKMEKNEKMKAKVEKEKDLSNNISQMIKRESSKLDGILNDKRKCEVEIDFLEGTKKRLSENISTLEEKKKVLKEKIDGFRAEKKCFFEKIRLKESEPNRIEMQNNVIETFLTSISEQISIKEQRIREVQKNVKLNGEMRDKIKSNIEKYNGEIKKKEKRILEYFKEIEHMRKHIADISLTGSELSKKIYRQEQMVKNKKSSLWVVQKRNKEKNREVAHHEDEIQKIVRLIENTKLGIKRILEKKECMVVKKEKMKEKLEQLKANVKDGELSVEVFINNFLEKEAGNNELENTVKKRKAEVAVLEDRLKAMGVEEKVNREEIFKLKKEREILFRKVSDIKKTFVDLKGAVKMKTFMNKELQKKYSGIHKKAKEVRKMYQLVKMDRNRYAKLIQDFSQTLTQVKENKKILENEKEILQRKSLEKEKEIKKMERKINHLVSVREENKRKQSILNKEYEKYRKISSERTNEVKKLNKAISNEEVEMMKLRNHFSSTIEERNFNGIKLMDRNDELCILHEKKSFQEQIITRGEVALGQKNDQIKLLQVHCNEILRRMVVYNEKLPIVQSLISEKEELVKEIDKHRKTNSKLNFQLESTDNKKRYRLLEDPKTPTEAELDLKIKRVRDKLSLKKEKIMEKQLILKEMTNSTDKIRTLAVQSRSFNLNLSSRYNVLKQEIRKKNDSLKSLLSEMSVFQANLLTIQIRNKQLKKNVEDMKSRQKNGHNPTREMIEMWERDELLKEKRKLVYKQYLLKKNIQKSNTNFATITRTAAVKRPNAYIPADDDLGIPKPYLLKPVCPRPNCSNMRHYAPPKRKDVVL